MGERKTKWYVVKAIAGKEKKAKEYIDNEICKRGLSDFVSNVLIPVEKVYSVRNGKKITKERTLFPGYIFVEARLEGEIVHIIKNIPNVLDFISEKNGNPIPMMEDEVQRILRTIDDTIDSTELSEKTFIVGETVKIIDGPFKNFDGVVEKINSEKRKLEVVVKIFGRRTPVELSTYQVEK
ncbi:MAG: transcription termination/antitermination protein NusG [Bacteroidales bacterium]